MEEIMNSATTRRVANGSSFTDQPFAVPVENLVQPMVGFMGACTKTMVDWNGEISRFLMARMSHNSETLSAIVHSDSLPELIEAEGVWFQAAVTDYLDESKRLIELNGEIAEGFFSAAQNAADASMNAKDSAKRVSRT
jgi:hypothetical protein